jgi:hypothetical protein
MSNENARFNATSTYKLQCELTELYATMMK